MSTHQHSFFDHSLHFHGADYFFCSLTNDAVAIAGFMSACTEPGGAGVAGSSQDTAVCQEKSWCKNGTQCDTSPSWLVDKVRLYWEWAQSEPGIHGYNSWHWSDRPTMSPASFTRGAVSLGGELLQAMIEVGQNITAAHPTPYASFTRMHPSPDPSHASLCILLMHISYESFLCNHISYAYLLCIRWVLPPLFFCVHNQCVPSGNRTGVAAAECALLCGPSSAAVRHRALPVKLDDAYSARKHRLLGPRRPLSVARSSSVPTAGAARLNVIDFGARGDGVTPDDKAIQSAIDAAQLANGTTPVIYFPGGRYLLENTLRVVPHLTLYPASTKLTGDGLQASRLISGAGLEGRAMLQYGSVNGSNGFMNEGEVSGLTFDGMGIAEHCINASFTRYSTFTNLFLSNRLASCNNSSCQSTGPLLRFDQGWGNRILQNNFGDCGSGVCLQGITDPNAVNIANNMFSDFSTAIVLVGGANVRIEGNEFGAHHVEVAIIVSGMSGLTISNNYFENGGNGTTLTCSDIVLNGALPKIGEPIMEPSTTDPCTGVVIAANYFNPNARLCHNYSAVTLFAAAGVSVSDNTCWAATAQSDSHSDPNLPKGFGMPSCGLVSTGIDAAMFFTKDIQLHSPSAVDRSMFPFALGSELGFRQELSLLPWCGAYSATNDGTYDCKSRPPLCCVLGLA